MDRVMTCLSQANTEVLKEPRTIIKLIQIVIAICAFACAVTNHSQTGFKYDCKNNETQHIKLPYYYPYNLESSTKFEVTLCEAPADKKMASCYGDFSNPAQFFVFVGTTAFLLCLAILIFYIFADDKYHQLDYLPIVDFTLTILYTILWFVSSSVWADAVVKIKHYTDPSNLVLANPFNSPNLPECTNEKAVCTPDDDQPASFSNLNISIIFGFMCVLVWAGNAWFLYRETVWFKNRHQDERGIDNSQLSPRGEVRG